MRKHIYPKDGLVRNHLPVRSLTLECLIGPRDGQGLQGAEGTTMVLLQRSPSEVELPDLSQTGRCAI